MQGVHPWIGVWVLLTALTSVSVSFILLRHLRANNLVSPDGSENAALSFVSQNEGEQPA